MKKNLLLIGILFLYLFVGLYQLDTIPGEIWGDGIFHYHLAEKILHGHFFIDYEYGGDGPVFSYLAAIVAKIIGLSFYSLKITAVFIGFFFVLAMYFLALEFFNNKQIALLSMALSATSFWTIVFVRQPHARILVPLFICLTLIATLKKKNTLAGLLLGIGMYTQASFWGIFLTFWKNSRVFFIGIILIFPLLFTFFYGPVNFFSSNSYFGEKLAIHTSISTILFALLSNIKANLLSFNFRGDSIFRMNIPFHPHLDVISGILFDIGFLSIVYRSIRKKQTQFVLYFILPFFFIQIPSLLDIHNYLSQPNISRMIGVIPFVYMSIAYCIYVIARFFSRRMQRTLLKKTIFPSVCFGLVSFIFVLNFYNYFYVYPRTLPNNNTPYGKLIAQTIDASSADTEVIIIGFGWGQYQQPEVAGIPIVQKTYHKEIFLATIEQAKQSLCRKKTQKNHILLVADPNLDQQMRATNFCFSQTSLYVLKKNDWRVASVLEGYR